MTTVTSFDVDNRFSWNQIDDIFDPLGALDMRVTFFDNGMVREEDYEGGVVVQKSVFDGLNDGPTDNFVWDRVDSYYDPLGSLTSEVLFYDDGRVKEETWSNGVNTMTVQFDNPGDPEGSGVKTWERIDTTFDSNGDKASEVTFYDNGVVVEALWTGGLRSQTTTYDNPQDSGSGGAKSFDRIEAQFDANGLLENRVTFYDNGTVKEELWQDGVRTVTNQYDNPQELGGPGVKAWDQAQTIYDASGQKVGKVTFYDDGRVLSQEWSEGLLSHSLMEDNPGDGTGGAKSWDRIETFFDGAGQASSRITIYDNGSTREDSFQFGQKVSSIAIDVEDNTDWIQSETYYDAFGSRETRTTQYDDGRVTYQTYAFGQLASSITEDAPFDFGNGAYDWASRGTIYENGERVLSGTTYDNGDGVLKEFAGDMLTFLHERDGDGSEAWLGRTTTYDLDGSSTVEYFYAEDEMPEVWNTPLSGGQTDSII